MNTWLPIIGWCSYLSFLIYIVFFTPTNKSNQEKLDELVMEARKLQDERLAIHGK